MFYTTYKANAKVTGAAFGWSLSKERDCVYLNAILQSGWNDETKKGSFAANRDNKEKNLSCKFNIDELGGILYSLNTLTEWTNFHTHGENKTQFKLAKWDRSSMKKPDAMGFSITRNGSANFKTFYEPGEIECLKVFLTEAIKEILWNKNAKQANE